MLASETSTCQLTVHGVVQEIPTGQGNRVRAEIYGLHEQLCNDANDLLTFFDFCFNQRSTASTNMNATSSRSHALFTITVRRVVVSVGDGVDRNMRAMVRTEGIESKLHLVDLAGACFPSLLTSSRMVHLRDACSRILAYLCTWRHL